MFPRISTTFYLCHLTENEGQVLYPFYVGMFLFSLSHNNMDVVIYQACAQGTYDYF